MVEVNFNPQVGERVQMFPHNDLYEILDRHANPAGELRLKLRGIRDGRLLDNVDPMLVDYPPEERIRRELRRMSARRDDWPKDFQGGRFEVKWDEMYDGTPRIMVYFHLKPEVVPSVSKARIWNEFYGKLQEKLEPLVDSGIWLQFTAREARDELSAAS